MDSRTSVCLFHYSSSMQLLFLFLVPRKVRGRLTDWRVMWIEEDEQIERRMWCPESGLIVPLLKQGTGGTNNGLRTKLLVLKSLSLPLTREMDQWKGVALSEERVNMVTDQTDGFNLVFFSDFGLEKWKWEKKWREKIRFEKRMEVRGWTCVQAV